MLTRNPQRRMVVVSYDQTLANQFGRDVRNQITSMSCDNGLGSYGVFMQGGDQASLTVRNLNVTGTIAQPFRVVSASTPLREWSNTPGACVNFPAGLPVRYGGGGPNAWFIATASPTMGVFSRGDRVINTLPAAGSPKGWVATATGGAYSASWVASTAYTTGQWIRTAAGRVLECTTAGTSSSTEPTPTTVGQVVTDGGVTWTTRALALAAFASEGNL